MLPTWLPLVAFISCLAGPLSHCLIWVRFDFETVSHQIVAVFLALQPSALLLLLAKGLTYSSLDSLIILTIINTTYLGSLFISIAIYRLYFHPLHPFSGPFWARLSAWYKGTAVIRGDNLYALIHRLHQKHGDVVRLGRQIIEVAVGRMI